MMRWNLRTAACLVTLMAMLCYRAPGQTAPSDPGPQTLPQDASPRAAPPEASPFVPPADLPPATLAAQIADLVNAPAVARDHWGILVTNLDGGLIYGLNQTQLFRPASNAKLFTTAAAMALLGADTTYETRLTGMLDPAKGIVKGDLTLVGAGDATLDSQDLPYIPPSARPVAPAGSPVPHQSNPMQDINDLVAQLAAKGVKQIDGDIVGDDTLFPWEPYPENWSIDDAVWGYGAPVSALTIADNELRLSIAPGAAAGQPANVLLEQAVPNYTNQAEVATVATKAEATGVQVSRTIGSRAIRVFGSIALNDETDVEQLAIDDPAEYAAIVLRARLVEAGIQVRGAARTRHRPVTDGTGFLAAVRQNATADQAIFAGSLEGGSCLSTPPLPGVTVLASHRSQPLAADVLFTNKVSQNLHAELFLRLLGRRRFCSQGSTARGVGLVRAFLLNAGMDPGDFVFYDGSGLSDHDLVTPRATAKLLQFARPRSHGSRIGKPRCRWAAKTAPWEAASPSRR